MTAPRLSGRQRRALPVLEEALLAAGDPQPMAHASAVVSGPHWLRLVAVLRSLDHDDDPEVQGDR